LLLSQLETQAKHPISKPMNRKLYAFLLLLLFFDRLQGQDCSTLSFTYATSESRCVATGSITVNVSGGSGDYNYKAIGPVTTPVTSSNIITGLAPGYYGVLVTDLSTGCTKQIDSIYVAGSYSDPRFQLIKTDASCLGNDGTISVANQQFGRSPFTYTIIAPSPSNVGTSNSTGSFSGLIPGEYLIQLQDSCGGIQVRRITIENYNWWFDSVSVVRNGCDMADVFIRIRDNKGNINTWGSAFTGFYYGYTDNGDTTWLNAYSFSVLLGTKRQLNIVVKDNCGNVHSNLWSLPDNLKPSLGSAGFTDFTCTDFKVSITGQNLFNPSFCLYDNSDLVITCNTNGQFSLLPYGSYCIKVLDACYDTLITRCFTAGQPIPSIASSVTISNRNCSTFTATITGQANLADPEYCLFDLNDVQIECNLTGVFNNISYGSYCIKVHDACTDTIITRCFNATRPTPVLTGYTISGTYCNAFGVQVMGNNLNNPQYCLFDSLGNEITCNSTGNFDSIPYGQYCVRAISCGDTTNNICFTGARPVPSVGPWVGVTNKECATFSVSVTDQTNLSNPEYCLYDENDVLITCDSTGVFDNVPYGNYCIKIHNNSGCFDTTITRCFTVLHDVPSIDATMQILSSNCTAVSFQVNGTNLTNPTYCLYNASNVLLQCNNSGTFNFYPYGQYCVRVEDGCVDTTMQVCQTFSPAKAITLTTIKSCTINKAYVDVSFSSGSSPYVVKVYHPNGSLVYANVTSSNPYRIELNALPTGTKYKVIAIDNCGNSDSATVTPDANIVTKNTTVRAKCPSSVWLNGSGDISAIATFNWYSVIPQIIKKNGTTFDQSYSSVTGNIYSFADLEPAQYIVQYTQSSCNGKLYDTITVSPYAYPTQGQSAVYQCDNNGFSLSADVHDGVSPYSFQIIGSLPETPSIVTAAQNNPVFSVNNGTTYSLIRLRTIDACGNATLSDVSVLPLQNVSVRVNDSCFYQNITLSIDAIPNADYSWYKKSTPVDSVLLGSGTSYNLPFFVPEEIGLYVCKVNVNDGCLTRLSSFNLTGNCYIGVLPTSFQLNGRKNENANQLSWSNKNEKGVIRYVVERKQVNETSFTALGTVSVQSSGNYFFNDNNFSLGATQYRLKVVYNNKTEYSNIIILKTNLSEITVYPNPVKNGFSISFNSEKPADYRIELIGTNGQLFYSTETRNNSSSTINYNRTYNTKPGIYLLRIIDKNTGRAEIRKLVFE
jgi:hypothetical protein